MKESGTALLPRHRLLSVTDFSKMVWQVLREPISPTQGSITVGPLAFDSSSLCELVLAEALEPRGQQWHLQGQVFYIPPCGCFDFLTVWQLSVK